MKFSKLSDPEEYPDSCETLELKITDSACPACLLPLMSAENADFALCMNGHVFSKEGKKLN
jgi:hypothetical protein